MDLTPLPLRPTAVDQCAQRLRDAILGGDLPAGSRLPPERALADQLGVNRVTVRGALGRLSGSGLLSVRQGSGYTVRDFRATGGSDLLGPLAEIARDEGRLPQVAAELLRVRRHLASALAERLAETRPSPVEIEGAVDRFEAAVVRNTHLEALVRADLAVLAAVLAAADSPALSLCMNPIVAVLGQLPPLAAAMYREPAANVLGWRAFVAWLRAPDPAGASALTALLAERDAATLAALSETVR
jgi:GntR family transcriptional regulator, transcriptional repressor for pyruvate dehydrogenase complex